MTPDCGICGGHITVTRFHLNASVFPRQYHSTHIIYQNFRNILIKLLGDELDDSDLNPDRGNIFFFAIPKEFQTGFWGLPSLLLSAYRIFLPQLAKRLRL